MKIKRNTLFRLVTLFLVMTIIVCGIGIWLHWQSLEELQRDALAELERKSILERQREGIEIAKREGKYKGRKPVDVDEKQFKEVCKKWRAGEITATAAMKEVNLKPNTFYRRVKSIVL